MTTFRLLTCSLLLLSSLNLLHPQETDAFRFPETKAGRLIQQYIDAYNEADSADIARFFQAYSPSPPSVPLDVMVERTLALRIETGRLAPLRMLEAEGTRHGLFIRTERGSLLRFSFVLEEAPTLLLRGIGIDQADELELGERRRSSIAQFAADLETFLTDETAADRFSGVVLVASRNAIVFLQPYGYADRERRIANNTETKFNLGSINKAFTALSIRQLAHQGKLRLSDTLKSFLSDYPNEQARQEVTVEQLLSMTSGIGDFFGARYDATPKESLMTIRSYVPLFADLPLSFAPGTSRRYSNGGYIVLGAIIEHVSGMDYYTYVRDHIFVPAGMSSSGYFPKDSMTANRAIGYTRENPTGELRPNGGTLPGRGSSAGGGYSTAMDLYRYVQALKEGTICPPDDPAQNGFGIAGGARGINAAFDWEPETGEVVIVLTNLDPPAAERVARRIRTWLPRP